MANIPDSALRELVKWAYYSSEYEGAVSMDRLRSLHPDVASLIDEIQLLDEARHADSCVLEFEDM